MTPSERDELFAASLALILPAEVPHEYTPHKNLTPEILDSARKGHYCDMVSKGRYPYYFTANHYCGHLLPVVEELWRACYLAE